jgi:hypothetical protein
MLLDEPFVNRKVKRPNEIGFFRTFGARGAVEAADSPLGYAAIERAYAGGAVTT